MDKINQTTNKLPENQFCERSFLSYGFWRKANVVKWSIGEIADRKGTS